MLSRVGSSSVSKVSDETLQVIKQASEASGRIKNSIAPVACGCQHCGCSEGEHKSGCDCKRCHASNSDMFRGAAAQQIMDRCEYAGFGVYIDPTEAGMAWAVGKDESGDPVIYRYMDDIGNTIRRSN